MRKGLSNILSRETLTNIILVFYFMSLLFEFHFLYNRVATLIRIIILSIFFAIIFIKYSNLKERKLFLIYTFLYLLFSIFHLLNIVNCSIFAEILYLVKMYMPVLIIYSVYKMNISLNKFYKTMNYCLALICGSIIICNLVKIGYSSYSFDPIKYNIFDWFKHNNYDFRFISSKGYFHLANQIIAIIILYMPLLINKIKEKICFIDVTVLITSLIALLMIGNRISSYMPLIMLISSIVIYLGLFILKKEKFSYRFLSLLFAITSIYIVLLNYAPINYRNNFYDNLQSGMMILEVGESNDIITEIDEKFSGSNININFPKKYYPYQNDPSFYNELLNEKSDKLLDTRFVEREVIKRVVYLNNKKMDGFLGIGYDRIMNIQNIEQDFIMQFYSVGIIGLILTLFIYILLYLYLAFKTLINFDLKFNYKNIMLLFTLGTFLVISYFSGNLLNSMSAIIPLSFVFGIAMNEITKNENKYQDKILGFNVYNDTKENLLNEIFGSNSQNIIYNINPLIVSNFYNNDNVVKIFNRQKHNIPDGFGIILASKIKSGSISRQIPGIELMESICKESINKDYKIYLYGAKEEAVRGAKENLEKKYKGIKIVGYKNGYSDSNLVLKDIINKKPDILFVALGSPKQENFIIDNEKKLQNIKIIMPVGGSFDVISGSVKRAPNVFIKLHLEWLYRMIKEPKRIKQNVGILKFMWLVIFKNNWYNEKSKGANDDQENISCI